MGLVMTVESQVWMYFFKQKTAYEMRSNDWSSYKCSSDLLAHQRKSDARLQQLVLVAALEFGVGVQPLTFEQRVAVLQVEQGTRGNRDDQRIGLAVWHGAILPGRGRMECDDATSGEQLQPEVNCSASIRSSRRSEEH